MKQKSKTKKRAFPNLDVRVKKTAKEAIAKINRKELVDLTCSLINIPSRCGRERECALFLVNYMKGHGLDAWYQEINKERGNAIGILPGKGDGPRLIFNGHMDTTFTGISEEDYPLCGPLPSDLLPRARVDGDRIFGLGAYNMKGGLAASVIAACAIKAAGIDLKGEIVVTAVSGETERTPVEGAIRSYRGDLYTGSAIGTQWLVDHGITGDFVINEEPSDCRICWENCGYCWFKVQAKGRMAYVARKEDGLNAILVMTKIIEEIEKWTPIYSAAHKSELTVPQVMVCAIEAGWPYKIGMCPAICNLYVDVRTAPGQLPQDAVREFSNFLEELQTCDPELNLTCDPYIVKAGERTDPDSYFVRSCIKAHESVIGKKHKNCLPGQAGAWTDCNVFRKAGIPAVSLGPGTGAPVTQGRQKSPQMWIGGESVSINQLMAAAKIYVMAALDICLRDRQELGLG